MFLMSASAANAAEKAGMPQLDATGWGPQIFWLFLTFTILYIVVWKIVVPRLSDSIEQRNDYISDNLEDAKKIVFTLEDEKKGVESLISGVEGGFTPLSGRLQRLKDLLERCALDPNLSKEERDKILNNKLKKDDSSLLEAYTGRNGRVYEIDIIDVLDNTIDVP